MTVNLKRLPLFFLAFCTAIAILLILYPSLVEIGVGITILLFGILNLEKGFKIFTEGPLRTLLRRSTNNLFKSIKKKHKHQTNLALASKQKLKNASANKTRKTQNATKNDKRPAPAHCHFGPWHSPFIFILRFICKSD